MKRTALLVCAVLLSTVGSIAAAQSATPENPWNGSWKADPHSFFYEGAPYTIAATPTGFTVSSGTTTQPPMVCDSKPHANPSGTETTCTHSASGYLVTNTKDGKVVSKVHVTASGSTLTRKIEYSPAGEDPYTMTFLAHRVSGGPGVGGTWKPFSFSESQDTGILSILVTSSSVSFKETDSPTPIVCALDGTPTKVPNLGGTMSVKVLDPHTLKVYYATDSGTLRRENTFVLGLDGKTITETDFTPAPGAAVMTLVLHKM